MLLLAVLNQGLHEHQHQEAMQYIRRNEPQVERRLDIVAVCMYICMYVCMYYIIFIWKILYILKPTLTNKYI